jgi:hypothetical protein
MKIIRQPHVKEEERKEVTVRNSSGPLAAANLNGPWAALGQLSHSLFGLPQPSEFRLLPRFPYNSMNPDEHYCSSGFFFWLPPFNMESCKSRQATITHLAFRFTCQAHIKLRQALNHGSSWLIFHSFFPSLLTYDLMQAQTSNNCSSGLFFSSSIIPLHLPGHTYPDKLQALIWLSSSPANHTSQAWMSHEGLSGLIFHLLLTTLATCLLPHTSPDEPPLLFWPLPHLLHPPFTHPSQMSSKDLSGLPFHLPTTHHKPRQAPSTCLTFCFIHQPLLLPYYLTQAQMNNQLLQL